MQQQTAAQLLSEQRQMIDAIDQQLVTLFEQRMDVVRQVQSLNTMQIFPYLMPNGNKRCWHA